MVMEMDCIEKAVKILNEAVELDEPAIRALINYRVPVNKLLAEHATIQVGTYHPESKETGACVGLLGIINGIFGTDEEQWGFIAVEADGVDENSKITKIKKFIDRRAYLVE
jgi:hypothetical protein